MKTVTVQIGNTDNKLTQQAWARYCTDVYQSCSAGAKEIHFSAPSVGWADWQNAAIVFTIEENKTTLLKELLEELRKLYKQDSIAWTEGETEFI